MWAAVRALMRWCGVVCGRQSAQGQRVGRPGSARPRSERTHSTPWFDYSTTAHDFEVGKVRDDTHWVKINTKHKAQKRVQSVPFVVGVRVVRIGPHGALEMEKMAINQTFRVVRDTNGAKSIGKGRLDANEQWQS